MKTGDEKFEKDLTWRASAERLSFDGLVCITRQTISIGTKLNLVRANCSYYMEECLPRQCAIIRSVKSKNNEMKFIQIIRTQRCRTIARNFCGEWHRRCGVSSALGSQSYSVCRNRFLITAYQTILILSCYCFIRLFVEWGLVQHTSVDRSHQTLNFFPAHISRSKQSGVALRTQHSLMAREEAEDRQVVM